MIENGEINRFQFFLLVVNFTIGSALLIIPSSVISEAKQDAWISILLTILIGVFLQYVMITLATKYPSKTLIDIIELLLGKIFGKIIGLLYVWFFFHLASLVLRNIIDFIIITLITETPIVVLSIAIGISLFYYIKYGLEVIARSNELYSFGILIAIILTMLLVSPLMEGKNILPVLENGIKPILRGTLPIIGFPYAELVVFLMIVPYINNKKNLKKIFISAGATGGLVLFIVTLTSILVLNPLEPQSNIYATYNVARLINIGDFITRMETLIGLTFIVIASIKLVISYYSGILALSQITRISDYRPLLFPTLIIIITLSINLNKNIVEELFVAYYVWTPYALIFGFLIPLILLFLSYFKSYFKKVGE